MLSQQATRSGTEDGNDEMSKQSKLNKAAKIVYKQTGIDVGEIQRHQEILDVFERFMYTETDSLHIRDGELVKPTTFRIHDMREGFVNLEDDEDEQPAADEFVTIDGDEYDAEPLIDLSQHYGPAILFNPEYDGPRIWAAKIVTIEHSGKAPESQWKARS